MTLDGVPHRGGMVRSELFDAAVASLKRYRAGAWGRPVVDRGADRLTGRWMALRMLTSSDVAAGRSRKNLFNSAFVTIPRIFRTCLACAICRADLDESMHGDPRHRAADADAAHAECSEVVDRVSERAAVEEIDGLRGDGLDGGFDLFARFDAG